MLGHYALYVANKFKETVQVCRSFVFQNGEYTIFHNDFLHFDQVLYEGPFGMNLFVKL